MDNVILGMKLPTLQVPLELPVQPTRLLPESQGSQLRHTPGSVPLQFDRYCPLRQARQATQLPAKKETALELSVTNIPLDLSSLT